MVKSKIDAIPVTLRRAIELIAGCLAKIKTPVPIMVVTPDKIMEDLNVSRLLDLSLYFCINPWVTKMLKSSPRPKMIVVSIMLTKLN